MANSREWAIRVMHELQEPAPVRIKGEDFGLEPDKGCMLTLTYAPEKMPRDGSVHKSEFQRFAKRARKAGLHFRYLHCGEYGEHTRRPHYHAAIIGQDFSFDRQFFKSSRKGFPLYRSPMLEDLWDLGHATVSDLSFDSAQYVARYVMKKQFGSKASEEYGGVRVPAPKGPGTVTQLTRNPPYATMSRKPGLGWAWFRKYYKSVYPRDSVIHRGKEMFPPRYYDTLLKAADPELYDQVKLSRIEKMSKTDPACVAVLRTRDMLTDYVWKNEARNLE